MECIEGMHFYIRGKTTDFPLRKEDLPVLYLSYRGIKEKRISWVAMSVGNLATNEGIMLGCIHVKNFKFHVY
jgi:hypothetical protein